MEMQNLMEKNRVMHHLLQKAAGDALEFDEVARQLKDLVGASVYMIDKSGEVLGYSDEDDMALFSLEELQLRKIEDGDMTWLFGFTQMEANQLKSGHVVTLVPMVNVSERLGTVLYARRDKGFDQEELMLLEYGAVVASIQLMRAVNQKAENEARKKNVVQLALEVLSYSELEAVKYIFGEIEGNEGFLVASKLAEEYKLTRSVIVNALRKLESAGVIDARSLGMKGTYIKILNDYLYEELAQV